MKDPASFRAQGSVFLDALAYYDETVPGGIDAVARASRDQDARRYCSTRFEPHGWYPLQPIVALNAAAATVAERTPAALAADCARWGADRKLRGAYRLALRMARPEWLAPRLPRAALRYFDFGRAEVNRLGSTRFEAWQRDIPAGIGDWLAACVVGVAPLALERCGARRVACIVCARAERGALVDLHYELSWG